MNLLVDTHVALAMLGEGDGPLPSTMRDAIGSERNNVFASVTTLWEISIKVQLGRLALGRGLGTVAEALQEHRCTILELSAAHVLAVPEPMPSTRDPFDRILLSVCLVENMKLLTWDKMLRDHPLAWRAASA